MHTALCASAATTFLLRPISRAHDAESAAVRAHHRRRCWSNTLLRSYTLPLSPRGQKVKCRISAMMSASASRRLAASKKRRGGATGSDFDISPRAAGDWPLSRLFIITAHCHIIASPVMYGFPRPHSFIYISLLAGSLFACIE